MKKQTSLFASINPIGQNILENFDFILQDIQNLNTKQLNLLSQDIRQLSHQLTDERSSRRLSYMNDKRFLTAYSRYFMWWNLVRLCSIFAALDEKSFDNLTDNSFALDLGSGPLTVVTALWLARPELWKRKITFYCMDISSSIMSLGEEIFLSVVAKTIASSQDSEIEPWKIIRIKGNLGTPLKNKVNFFFCANVFNEMFENSSNPIEHICKNYITSIEKYLINNSKDTTSIFIAEPGIPRSAHFISLTRDALIRKNYSIISPCPHINFCPMDGRRKSKWCHFILNGKLAPKGLQKLSEDSGLPKDRASISFIFAKNNYNKISTIKDSKLNLLIASDSIKLPNNKKGYYACSEIGLVLYIEKNNTNNISSGIFIKTDININEKNSLNIDKKSGAYLI